MKSDQMIFFGEGYLLGVSRREHVFVYLMIFEYHIPSLLLIKHLSPIQNAINPLPIPDLNIPKPLHQPPPTPPQPPLPPLPDRHHLPISLALVLHTKPPQDANPDNPATLNRRAPNLQQVERVVVSFEAGLEVVGGLPGLGQEAVVEGREFGVVAGHWVRGEARAACAVLDFVGGVGFVELEFGQPVSWDLDDRVDRVAGQPERHVAPERHPVANHSEH
jgi:hypothetical protein